MKTLCITDPYHPSLRQASLCRLRSVDVYMRQRTEESSVQVMTCRLFSAKPLPEPVMNYFQLDILEQTSSDICVIRQYFSFTKLQLKLSSPKCLPHVYLRELHKGNGFYLLCWWWIVTGRYSDSSPDVRRALTLRCNNTLKLRQDGHHFSEDIFKCIFLNEMYKFQWRIHWSLILFFYLCFHIN